MKKMLTAIVVFSVATAFPGCSESTLDAEQGNSQPASVSSKSAEASETTYGDKFPEVLEVAAVPNDKSKWHFSVTLSSAYDSPNRYADAWRVLDDQDQELGIRELGHDHATEQPFTRSETIEIPSEVKVVFVEGRDQGNGWSGQRFEYQLPSGP